MTDGQDGDSTPELSICRTYSISFFSVHLANGGGRSKVCLRRVFLHSPLPSCTSGTGTELREEEGNTRRFTVMAVSTLVGSQATEALLHSPIPALRKLQVEQTEGGIVLSGSVSSYYLKQLAQETVLPYLDHQALVNRVTVVR